MRKHDDFGYGMGVCQDLHPINTATDQHPPRQ
jgi:hypothetical protein